MVFRCFGSLSVCVLVSDCRSYVCFSFSTPNVPEKDFLAGVCMCVEKAFSFYYYYYFLFFFFLGENPIKTIYIPFECPRKKAKTNTGVRLTLRLVRVFKKGHETIEIASASRKK